MNILVYDIAAENGGAVTVLNWFYERHKLDKNNNYVYLLSNYELSETENIKVVQVPKVKKSWLHRLWFDWFSAPGYIKKYSIDRVLSLQNTDIPLACVPQTLYVHNALPFCEHRFRIGESRFLWVYQNIIGRMIKSAIRRADETIVQTPWMKDAVMAQVPHLKGKVTVMFPKMKLYDALTYVPTLPCTFFYPANEAIFKNHALILAAAERLKEKGVENYRCVFTLDGNENETIVSIRTRAAENKLPFFWVGRLNREQMGEWYAKSVLIFPSYIETVGLPLCEAMSVNAPILAADCQYARGVISDYSDVQFFDYRDAEELAQLMEYRIVSEQHEYEKT